MVTTKNVIFVAFFKGLLAIFIPKYYYINKFSIKKADKLNFCEHLSFQGCLP